MASPLLLRRFAAGFGRQIEDALGDLFLRLTGPAGELFNRPPTPVPGVEIQLGIDAGRIEPQHLLHAAKALENLPPIQQGELSQAGKPVPD